MEDKAILKLSKSFVILSLPSKKKKKTNSLFVYISSPSRQAQRTTEWCNSPNAYLKQEIEETGTPNPKKVTKVNIFLSDRLVS
jgi:hypothetical protein